MGSKDFFDEPTEQSQIKAFIVKKYFWSWAKIMLHKSNSDRIAYIDLFAGPGRYQDETKSTPLLILESAIIDPDPKFREKLVTIFNDKDSDCSKSLKKAIDSVEGIEKLKYEPQVFSEEVGERITSLFEHKKLVPTLFFVDPWGYKGLSLKLINSVLKNWGSDCLFFFNYNRMNIKFFLSMFALLTI